MSDLAPPTATGDGLSWEACLHDAIQYYHSCLDQEIGEHTGDCDHDECETPPNCAHDEYETSSCSRPSTASQYYEDVRGWDTDLINATRLGYAPPDGEIVSHLLDEGHTPETLLSTGLFTKDLAPLWQGRYVFPYLHTDNSVTYAISRSTGGSSGHPADFLSGKYANLAHTKSYSEVAPKPFGLHTLETRRPVVIAEGIADAITAHKIGWACISPGAVRFSSTLFEEVISILHEHEVPRIYVVGDADRPSSAVREKEHNGESKLELQRASNTFAYTTNCWN